MRVFNQRDLRFARRNGTYDFDNVEETGDGGQIAMIDVSEHVF